LANRLLFRIATAAILLCSIAIGGMDQSGDTNAMNMTTEEFSSQVPSSSLQDSFVETDAPAAVSTSAGTDIAFYTDQAPSGSDLQKLLPSSILINPPGYMYYNGDYLTWYNFTASFPADMPAMWIERAVSWSFYATMPWGGWTRALMYVPQASPVTMYEIYPASYILRYNLGSVQQPGYYYIWYYADAIGRHSSFFSTNSGYSNTVIIDVYGTVQRTTPTAKEECEKRSYCSWVNNQCLCYMPQESEKEKCEKTSGCYYVNNKCQCVMPEDPEKEECEKSASCDWVNNQCYCRGVDDSKQTECEKSGNCHWVDGQCDCTMPIATTESTTEWTSDTGSFNPSSNPTTQCESGCYWANGRCNCMGAGGGSGVSDNSDNTGSIEE